MVRLEKKDLVIFIFLWLGIALFLTLWPFNFLCKNVVTATPGGGFHFESPSIAYLSHLPIKISELKKFSLIMEVKSDITLIDIDGIIFGNCINYDKQNFLMVQVRENVEFFISANGVSREIFGEGIFEKDNPVWIEITYDGNKLTFLKNGSVKNVVTIENLDFSRWNSSYPFVFANGGDGMNPWSGTIFSFDVFDSVVTISDRQHLETIRRQVAPLISLSVQQEQTGPYQLQGNISAPSVVIPARFNPPGKSLLISLLNLTEWGHIDYMDFFLNIVFFLPFGFLLRLLLEKYTNRYYLSFFITIMTGLLLTITIETLQSFLPIRYTSILDVLSNTLGTIIGAMIITSSWVRQLLNLQRQK